ncbi:MAG: hypothetical protein NXI10_01065 [bacterium]|nr:hypothetical protein [bacterium]
MEQFYVCDSLTAYSTEDGILIEEKKKGTLKMVLTILLMGVLMLIGGLLIGIFGGTIGMAVGPWLIWGSILVLAVAVISFIIKLAMNQDPKITLNKHTKEVTMRGKVIAFSDISAIDYSEQSMMSKTMVIAFLIVNGKKKSLFSTALVSKNPKETVSFIKDLERFIQNEGHKDASKEDAT